LRVRTLTESRRADDSSPASESATDTTPLVGSVKRPCQAPVPASYAATNWTPSGAQLEPSEEVPGPKVTRARAGVRRVTEPPAYSDTRVQYALQRPESKTGGRAHVCGGGGGGAAPPGPPPSKNDALTEATCNVTAAGEAANVRRHTCFNRAQKARQIGDGSLESGAHTSMRLEQEARAPDVAFRAVSRNAEWRGSPEAAGERITATGGSAPWTAGGTLPTHTTPPPPVDCCTRATTCAPSPTAGSHADGRAAAFDVSSTSPGEGEVSVPLVVSGRRAAHGSRA
jgi:hypothetical protein